MELVPQDCRRPEECEELLTASVILASAQEGRQAERNKLTCMQRRCQEGTTWMSEGIVRQPLGNFLDPRV
eukprot:scaffold2113_cov233-Pinguiococcus_pyrenoidosus.AAC.21